MIYKTISLIVVAVLVGIASTPVFADLESAQALYEQGRTREAMAEVEKLLQSNPTDPELRFLKGIIFAEEGRNDAAIEVFAGLAQDYPDLPEPYNNLAVLFAEKGEFEKARDSLLAAIQTHPSYSTAHENLGDLYAKMAGMAYNRALEEDRANESARLKLSGVNGLFMVPRRAELASTTEPKGTASVVARAPDSQPPTTTASQSAPAATPRPADPEPITVAAAQTRTPSAAPDPVRPAPVVSDSTPATDPGRDAGAIATVVESWRNAWSAQDVGGYVTSYTDNYSPSRDMSHSAWQRQRRQRLSAPSFIDVQVNELQVQFVDDGTAQASFVQIYRSDSYEDRVRKTLTLTLTESGWRIARERSDAI